MTAALVRNPFVSREFTQLLVCWLLLLGFGLVMVSSAAIALGGGFATKHSVYRYFHVGFFADLYLTHKPMEQVVLNRLVRRIDRRCRRVVTWSWTHRKRCDALVADWRIYLTSV